MNNEMEMLITSDFVLASTLLCLGFDIAGIDKADPKRVKFYYKRTSDLETILRRYRGGEVLVKPQDFAFAQREIKGIIHSGTI